MYAGVAYALYLALGGGVGWVAWYSSLFNLSCDSCEVVLSPDVTADKGPVGVVHAVAVLVMADTCGNSSHMLPAALSYSFSSS